MTDTTEDRLIAERTIPSLKGQPAIPDTPITEAEWQRQRDERDMAEGLREAGWEVETFHWSPEHGLEPVKIKRTIDG
jgi:hypothetical protein